MKLSHFFMVLATVAIWGFNFVFIRIGLNGLPPILMCALRFLLSAIPLVFFFKRPNCSIKLLMTYGIVLFGLQFAFLFSGMKIGMSAGLASLLMQTQVFFTMALGAWIFKERPTKWKIIGALISFSGIIFVALHTEGDITLPGLVLTVLAASSWGLGNILSKKIGTVPPLSLVVWGSVFSTPFLFLLSFIMEGPDLIVTSLQNITFVSIGAILYNVILSTHIAYSLWSYLLNKYPTSVIAPFTLLVPIFGFIGSVLFLGETLPFWKIAAAILVIAGLCFNLLENRLKYYYSHL